MSSYINESLIDSESDPLIYWKMKEIEMPILAKFAKKFLSAPMGSVASEREFKVASDITGGDRTRLLPENAEMLLFLKYNLRAVGYNSLRLPRPPKKTVDQPGSSTPEDETDDEDSDIENQSGDEAASLSIE